MQTEGKLQAADQDIYLYIAGKTLKSGDYSPSDCIEYQKSYLIPQIGTQCVLVRDLGQINFDE